RVWLANAFRLLPHWTERSVEWLAMTEDLPSTDNRVTVEGGRIRVRYRPHNADAHKKLLGETERMLRALGFWYVFPVSFETSTTTHQCGTLTFGTDPKTSV